jgi:hypothetical protein
MKAKRSERHESLWTTVASPLIWAAHFLLSYGTAALWCAKVAGRDGSLGPAQIAIASYTVLALASVLMIGRRSYNRSVVGSAPHEADSGEGRHRFLGFATLLLSGLSAIAIFYTALAAAIVGSCR